MHLPYMPLRETSSLISLRYGKIGDTGDEQITRLPRLLSWFRLANTDQIPVLVFFDCLTGEADH